jgi:serine/threonine-protein kinase
VLARHHASGVLVAIKYLRQDLLADQGFAEMFRDEAQTLASLDDPNVVRLYEYVESPSGAAIVMELVEGVSLREILTHQGSTKPESALVVLQVRCWAWPRRTGKAWCTATTNRRTYWSTATARAS